MKLPWRFIRRFSLLCALNLLVALIVLYGATYRVEKQKFANSETESCLLVMPRGEHRHLVMLGTSHGRNFARNRNHERVEQILGVPVTNLSVGQGGGIVPAAIFLSLFYDRGNSACTVVYLVDPWPFFSGLWNEDNVFAEREPFALDLAWQLIRHGCPAERFRRYLVSKLRQDWLGATPRSDAVMSRTVERVQPDLIQKRLANLYPDGMLEANRARYARVFEGIIATAREHGSQVILVRPPKLLGREPGDAFLDTLLADMVKKHGARVLDHSTYFSDVSLYEDHDHLNTRGVEAYTRQVLLPIVSHNAARCEGTLATGAAHEGANREPR